MTISIEQETINKAWLRPTLHPAYSRLLCAQLRQQKFSDKEIFEGTLMSWDDLLKDNQFISFHQSRRILLQAIRLTGMPWINLVANSATQTSFHGILGYGVASGRNVAQSLQLVSDLSQVRQQIVDFVIEDRAPDTHFVMKPLFDFGDIHVHTLSGLMNIAVRFIEAITGDPLHDMAIYFSFPEPDYMDRFEKCFKYQTLHFNAEHTAIEIPEHLLQMDCLTYDPEAFKTAKRECARLIELQNSGGNTAQKIRNILLAEDIPNITLEEMSSLLNMSSRSLIRKLKAEDLNYQMLLDDVRKEYAVWYLLNSNKTVENIADRVGYKDPSNFSRAFRRWYEVTPNQFRQKK